MRAHVGGLKSDVYAPGSEVGLMGNMVMQMLQLGSRAFDSRQSKMLENKEKVATL